VVTDASYNGALAPGASTSFGFIASVTGANNPPATLTCTTS
jgi:alpha-L-fucosidase 2